MTPLWALELAEAFWLQAGAPEPFPRRLRDPATLALDVQFIDLPDLTLGAIRRWWEERDHAWTVDEPDVPLLGCLLAEAGHGFVFVEARLGEAERAWTTAHELGHLLRDYLAPRERAVARLGRPILAVFDGHRGPTADEKVRALLGSVRLGRHHHLLCRGPGSADETRAEREADVLARELLAPADHVQAGGAGTRAELTDLLSAGYGLPPRQAHRYACEFFPEASAPSPLVRRLFGVRPGAGNEGR